ncbi:hypothetical protein Tco_0525834 [Tanacetum coccineum]
MCNCPQESKILYGISSGIHPLRFSFELLHRPRDLYGIVLAYFEGRRLKVWLRCVRDMYYNLQDDDIMKNIFNSGRHKNKVGMQIPAWMITDEMKLTEHYRMYVEVFGIDVSLTQSQPTKSTQGTHRTPSDPRSPNPDKEVAESSAPRRSTMIRLCLPERRSTRLTPPAPVPTVDKADDMVLQDTLQVRSLLWHKQMKDGGWTENILVDSSFHRNDESNIPGTRIEPRSDKESPEVEIAKEMEVSCSSIKTNIDMKFSNVIPFLSRCIRLPEVIMSGNILHVHLAQSQTSSVSEQQYQLYLSMKADPQLQQQDIAIWLALQIKFERNTVLQNACKAAETSEYEALMCLGESSSGHGKKISRGIQAPSTLGEIAEQKRILIFGLTLCLDDDIVARRANDCIVSITEPDYKNLNKNDIEDIYLLIMNGKVPDYADTGLLWFFISLFKTSSSLIWERVYDFQLGIESYQQKVNLTVPTMTFPGIKDHETFFIIYEHVRGIIFKNSKKEKRVMRHSKIYKFCDATLNRVLEGLKSYNNDVKYGYVQKDLTKDETEYLKLFEEEIEERLKHRRQMRRWEMYVNGRPLGSRRGYAT